MSNNMLDIVHIASDFVINGRESSNFFSGYLFYYLNCVTMAKLLEDIESMPLLWNSLLFVK